MRKLISIFTVLFVGAALAMMPGPAFAKQMKPGKGIKVQPARATWSTGFFNEALVRRGLTELGYDVQQPKDLQNPIFYKSVVLGDVDYWANGWFPLHDEQLPKDFNEKAEVVGDIAKSGGLQGYLVSKREIEKFKIKSLDDFKRDDVKKAFDTNGDGKADLTACPPGWGCEKAIAHHLDIYGLEDDINPIKAGYEAAMASAIGNYKSGGPVFFYTWTPNWTTYKLKPGEDVMWINVPGGDDADMAVSGLEGAVSDPINLGFKANDIQIVANKKFLADNPAARKFFEVFRLNLGDINEQNARMNEGEKSQKDIERHVDQWIAKNQAKWNGWIEAARNAAK